MVAEGPAVTGPLLTFRVGAGRFAVLLEDVLGVLDPAEIGAAGGRGIEFQGQPVDAVDARELWRGGLDTPAAVTAPAVIIVSSSGRATALVVDRVEGIVEGVETRPLPELVAPFVRNVFRGIIRHGDGNRLVVDTASLARAATGGGQRGPGEA